MKYSILSLVLLFLFAVTCAPPSSLASQQCVEIIKAKCIDCHYASRICQKLGKKSKRKWKKSLKSMRIRGSTTTPAEEKALMQCLSKSATEVKEYCKNP